MTGNLLQGNLPSSLASLSNLTYLDVSDNRFRGPLIEVDSLTQLESFKAQNNFFAGGVPKSFGDLPQLETLYLQDNQLKGDVNFLCRDLPLEYELDCYEKDPEIVCNCCVGCTFVNETECNEDQKMVFVNIIASSSDFEWKLESLPVLEHDEPPNSALIAAGGNYSPQQQLGVQLCLQYPSNYRLMTSSKDAIDESKITIAIDSQEWTLTTPDHIMMEVWKEGAAQLTHAPTPRPTPRPTPPPTSVVTSGSTPTVTVTAGTGTASWTGSPTTSSSPSKSSQPSNPPTTTAAPSESPTTPAPTSSYVLRPTHCLLFDLSIKTDAFGQETSWEVVNIKDNSTVMSESSLPSDQIVQHSECLNSKGCYDFIIRDSFNDGICCVAGSGNYNVSISGRVVGSGGQFGSSETQFLGGNCGVDADATNSCPDQYSLLNVTIRTGRWGYQTSWQMVDASNNHVLALNEIRLASNMLSSVTKCVVSKDCYRFSLYDSYGDGLGEPGFWIVALDGKDVFSGGWNDFNGRSKSKTFGLNCPG